MTRSVRSPRVQIAAVGRLRAPFDVAGSEFEERLARMLPFRVDEVAAESLQRGEARARRSEAERLSAVLARNAWRVALSPAARAPVSSEAFAAWLEKRLASGRPVVFLVGGAAGLDEDLIADCEERLGLGPLTMPHQLARVVLTEQLYRAACTLQGHPYPH
ncbi:MAG: 23S rRNA (pseudouridine(1915)-N(3))-methyltransferase RlmH [Actinobacteria bacterium]|nr:23S rRNA (pseudouridine(1915)-N(3))-methyltransferase RlmH [Thermoleophilia bacterium]MCB9012130.1 23S rRNA (pseudouridine(1915)-N(3))-methyltransferase RlmH [Actinomycetota bacterium]